ncbi:MAG: class I SAM-dependent methyltransferase [Chloroflexota bacterium]|nr:class I SAM-dependent methyltransferase [Chloroflexota bacterium]
MNPLATIRRIEPWPKSPIFSRQARQSGGIGKKAVNTEECPHPRARFKPIFATQDYITGKRFAIGYCYSCRLHVTWPVPPDEAIKDFYPSSYYGSGQRFAGVVEWLLDALYSFRVYYTERHQSPGKVLDVGCGRGLLLNKLRERGWETHGTELSEEAAAYAREKLNLPVTAKKLEDAHFASAEFDLVVLWHVLEHVRAPRLMLHEVARILKPGGMLLVAVPNFGSWEARFSGKGWFHLDVPRHLTHFTPRTLKEGLDEAGLDIISANFFSTEYDFFSFVQSGQNRLGFRHNLLYNVLRTRSAKVIGSTSRANLIEIALVLLTAIPLALLSLIYAPVAAALGQGATIAAYAVKRET